MNVLQVLPELNVGGVETGTVDLAKWLKQNGHKAVVISGGGRLVRRLEGLGTKHYQLPVGRKSPFSIVPMIRAVRDIIEKEDIDIVHARSRVPAIIAFFAARPTKAVFITTAHGYYGKHVLSRVMGWGRYVIVASNVMARHMMENFSVPFDRIRLIPRGVDFDKYPLRNPRQDASARRTIGMIGRLSPLKGHSDFLTAVSIIFRTIPHIKVKIVGDTNKGKEKYKDELKLLCRRLGIANCVEFIDHSDNVSEIFDGLDALVLASVIPEGFGRVIIEAQASGVPVVATRVGGVVDIIEDGLNGVLVDAKDPNSIAEGILKVLKDKELALRLAQEGRRVVENRFTLDIMCRKTFDVYREALDSQNILVIKISAIGDVILSIPSLRAIREKFPIANIKALVGLKSRNSLKGCPYVNDVIVCDFDGKDKGLLGLLKLAADLRKYNFDITVDLQNNRKTHILSFLSFAPLRYGYKNGKMSGLLSRGVKEIKKTLDPVDHQFRVLNNLGISSKDKRLELWPSKEDEEWASNFLASNWTGFRQTIVGINIGSSERWITKRWPIPNYARLCDELSKKFRARVIITGIRKDMEDAKEVFNLTRSKPIISCGKTNITQLAALMKRCKVFVTGDSAPVHVATAIGLPYVALFGPTNPKRHIVPVGEEHVIIYKNLRCAPCYKSRCILNYRCMTKISVEEVVNAVGKFIK